MAASIMRHLPIDDIEHGESAMPGGKMTLPGARDLIKSYAARKTRLPPIDVVSNDPGSRHSWMVVDGSHRLEAAKLRGDTHIHARISPHDEEGIARAVKYRRS